MKILSKNTKSVITATLILFLMTVLLYGQDNVWRVPSAAEEMENPTKFQGENKIIAKGLYNQHCKSCHGKSGEGDGTKAEELKTFPGDFTTDDFQEQSDGALFYKIQQGRDEMPGFDKKMTEEDSWLVVHYLRTLQ